jgi:hypothetical protein
MSASQQAAALAFARCMRSHGVPNFPDPTFTATPSGGPSQQVLPNPQAPAFKAAAAACGGSGRIFIG